MVVAAIIALVLVGIYVVFGSIRQHRLLINGKVLIIAFIAIALLGINNYFHKDDPALPQPEYYQLAAPSFVDAPYQMATPSRGYYIVSYHQSGQYLWLDSFYEFNKKKWVLSKAPVPFDTSLPEYANLTIIKRGG